MDPFLGEIRFVTFQYAPKGWMPCNGQLLPIAQYQPLFSLLGTTYGGDGRTTFALPDLRGRTPVHPGDGIALGQAGGSESVVLTPGEAPAHTHALAASAQRASTDDPAGGYWAASAAPGHFAPTADTTMAPGLVSATGGSQPHENRQPSLVISAVIAVQGIFPPRS
jgi:microcystin-dependent protein